MALAPPTALLKPLKVKEKLLMGPGPSNCAPRVLHALSQPVLGHFHAATFQIMDEIKEGLKYVFQTENPLTLAISGSGHSGMEAAICNLVEPGDKILVLINGFWGIRAADMASRYGGEVYKLEVPPGTNASVEEITSAIAKHRPSVLFVTQGDSSTGVVQPVEKLGPICHKYGCLLIVDAVASLGGVPLFTDRWSIDCVYAGSQKVLGSPPGLTPITFSPRAEEKIRKRKTLVAVFYLDMNVLGQYWACFENKPRVYHHTISTTLLYGLREALAMLAEEGLEACVQRHVNSAELLRRGLEKLGFELFVKDPLARLNTVTTVTIPKGLNWSKVLTLTLQQYDLEVAGGLGPTAGLVFRIGVMGQNAKPDTVRYCLEVLEQVTKKCKL